jgi:hypothetical protein
MFIDPDDPVRTLAALYHDVVYYQVDQKFTEEIERLVKPYIQFQRDGSVCIAEHIPEGDRMIAMAVEMFDLRPGQRLPAVATLNEFLSAVVMLRQLEDFVAAKQLVLITMMIEATIPFRPPDDRGRTHFEVLAERLRGISRKYCQEPLSEGEIEGGVKDAVLFSNKDIESFAEPDPARFLDNTWKLLPETNPLHLVRILYTIRSYRQALSRCMTSSSPGGRRDLLTIPRRAARSRVQPDRQQRPYQPAAGLRVPEDPHRGDQPARSPG